MSTVPIPHPSWCSRDRCTYETSRGLGLHRSRPTVIKTDDGAQLTIGLWRSGALPDGTASATHIELVTRPQTSLTLAEGAQLRHALTALIELAAREGGA